MKFNQKMLDVVEYLTIGFSLGGVFRTIAPNVFVVVLILAVMFVIYMTWYLDFLVQPEPIEVEEDENGTV